MATTRQQTRAIAAHRLVNAQLDAKNIWDKYRTDCMKGPTLLQQSGLMQTTVFCESRSDDAARQWIADVAEVMGIAEPRQPDRFKTRGEVLANQARTSALAEYLALSRDALDAATWLRRYAMAAARAPESTAGKDQEPG